MYIPFLDNYTSDFRMNVIQFYWTATAGEKKSICFNALINVSFHEPVIMILQCLKNVLEDTGRHSPHPPGG